MLALWLGLTDPCREARWHHDAIATEIAAVRDQRPPWGWTLESCGTPPVTPLVRITVVTLMLLFEGFLLAMFGVRRSVLLAAILGAGTVWAGDSLNDLLFVDRDLFYRDPRGTTVTLVL